MLKNVAKMWLGTVGNVGKCCGMVGNGVEWWEMVMNGVKWWQMVRSGKEYWEAVENGFEWWGTVGFSINIFITKKVKSKMNEVKDFSLNNNFNIDVPMKVAKQFPPLNNKVWLVSYIPVQQQELLQA